MSNEPLPDWCAPEARAYVLRYTMTAGVGAYPTATRVRIVKITATQVQVRPYNDTLSDATSVFRRRDLAAPRTGGRYAQDDRLAGPRDPDVTLAHGIAGVVAAIPAGAEFDRSLRLFSSGLSMAQLANDFPTEVDALLAAMRRVRDDLDTAIAKVRVVREQF